MTVQLEKYGRPRFILNLGIEPLDGFDSIIEKSGTGCPTRRCSGDEQAASRATCEEREIMISISVSVDVANMADGARFYTESFGFSKVSEPTPGVVVLRAGTSAGAKQEQLFENPGYPPVAFCGDPFGQADARNPRG